MDNKMINKKDGFTLVELLIVMTIVITFAIMMIGIFNTIGVSGRGRDAQRKKDLRRIKIAFEEYFNDKGYFPDVSTVADLQNKSNCKSKTVFSPYLIPWPCDPNGETYKIVVESNPNRFRIITNLESKKDKDIPLAWYLRGNNYRLFGWTINDVNYGVSSANILWYDGGTTDYSMCNVSSCHSGSVGDCGDVTICTNNCFYQNLLPGIDQCTPGICNVSCCGSGCSGP